MSCTNPCPTCPWRRTSTVGGADIPGFDLAKMQNLACTVGEGDAFRVVMACHYSPEGDEYPCIGYVAVEGWSNLAVRLGVIQGRIPEGALDAADRHDMWPSFAAMLAAYEAA